MGVSKEMQELLATAEALAVHKRIYIESVGVPTGSVAFGVATACSDQDYVLSLHQFESLCLGMDVLRYSNDEGYNFEGYRSFYVKCASGEVFNLLVMEDDVTYKSYIHATIRVLSEMERSSNYKEQLRDKAFRVAEFEKFKSQYREEANE